MKIAAAAMLTIAAALLVPPSIPAAFGNEANAMAHRHHAARRHLDRRFEGLAIASVVVTAPAAWTPFQGTFINPFATPPRPLEWPKIAPYPPGQGDTDGLSSHYDDCNKGCIGVSEN